MSEPLPARRLRNAQVAAAVGLAAVVAGLLIRIRILLYVPFVADSRALWLAVGAAEDLAVAAVIVAVATFAGRAFAVVATSLFLLGHFALSELVIAFGEPFRAEDLQTGLHPILFAGEATAGVLLALLAIGAAYAALAIAFVRWNVVRRPPRRALEAVVGIAIAIAVVAHGTGRALTAEHPLFTAMRIAGEKPISQFKGEVAIAAPRRDPRELRALSAVPRPLFYDDRFPLAHRSESAAPATLRGKPNIVFVVLESLRTNEVGALGGSPAGLTPNLDALVRGGTPFANAYSVGGYTPEGELGLWYALLASPHELVMRTRPNVDVYGLPDLLRAAGWRSFFWIHGSDQTLYSSGQFYKPRGFRVIDGRDFAPSEPRTSWGFSDRALMRQAIDTLASAPQPFAAMVLTISNHHPFALPDDARTRLALPARVGSAADDGGPWWHKRTMAMLATTHYTDEAVGEFFAAARTQPWFANTIFVIAGDHGAAVPPYGRSATAHEAVELRHHVPLILWSPMLPPAPIRRDAVSQADILPTLLGLLGIAAPRPGTGIDLARPADHPVLSWALEARVATVREGRWTYHAWVAPRSLDIERELLVDTIADPRGERDAMHTEPRVAQRLRNLTELWLDGYAQLVRAGRSGVPR